MNRSVFYLAAGALLLFAAGFVSAQGYGVPPIPANENGGSSASVSVSVSVNSGYPPVYSHYCGYSYYYGYYNCYPTVSTYGPYCDPFDPFYSRYCYAPYVSYYYPTYVVNPGTVVYATSGQAQPQVQGPPCSDGTPAGLCSSDYPKYCFSNGDQSVLIDKATLCGCSPGQVQDPSNRNRCIAQTCEDGTALNTCSATRPSFCTSNGFLVDRPEQCGCPAGTKLEGGVCASLNSICFVSTTASTVRAGESVSIDVPYSDVDSQSGFVTCGNGQVASLACSGGRSGTCVASCSYPTLSSSPFVVQARVNGQLCSSSTTVNVVSQLPTTGNVLVRATDCATGAALPGASVNVGGQSLVANANGEARSTQLSSGLTGALVSSPGYIDGAATTVVSEGRTSVVPVCLNRGVESQACDVGAEIAGTVTTDNVQNGVQLRVKNNLGENNAATLTYSSAVHLAGPVVVPLLPGESKIVAVYPLVAPSFSGSSVANVNVMGRGTCSVNVQVPLNLNGGLSMQPLSSLQSMHAGGSACYDLLLQNKGGQTEVRLASSATGLTISFDEDRFVLASGETRMAKMCADIPEGAVGRRSITVRAVSGFNPVSANVDLVINPFMYSNVLGCFNVNSSSSQFMEVRLTNTGPSESFVAALSPSRGFSPRLTQENIFNFANGSTRSLYVQVDPSSMNELDSRATLTVFTKDSRVKVFEQELCFQKPGAFDLTSFISPVRVTVEQGQTGRAFVHVRNAGNVADNFEVVAVPPFQEVSVVSSRLSLLPGQEKTVEVAVSPGDVLAGTYLVPIDVYSLRDPAARILVASLNLVVDVKQSPVSTSLKLVLSQPPLVSFNQSTGEINVKVPVANYDDTARRITPSLSGLPETWAYTVNPSQATIPSLGETEFEFNIKTKNLESRDYNATIVLTDEFGRQSTQTVVLPAKSSNWLTGFFVLGSTSQLFLVLIAALVLIGLYFLYKVWVTRQAVHEQELVAVSKR